jgi:glycosyltransferase involved in cell wall biosynthesis
MPLASHVVSNSRAGEDVAVRRGAKPGNVSVFYNGRDIEKFATATPTSRQSIGLAPDATVVGTVGRLTERKGQYDLLEAWTGVVAAQSDARLLIVGEGPERGGLKASARELNVEESIRFLGVRGDVPALLELFDMFVFSSHFEGLPGAVIEAMAAGVPIVATDIVGTNELLTDGETGLLVPPEDASAIEAAMTRALSDGSLAKGLGETAARKARDAYSIPRMIESFAAVYESLLTGGEPRNQSL